jgi:hypothetical protein
MYSETLLDEIKLITGIDLNEFLSTFVSFMDYDYIEIANYYSGISKIPNGESFKNLNNLLDNSKFFINLLNLNKEKFFTIEIWEVLIILEEINNKLLFTNNISKFLRSSIIKGQFNLGVINYLSLNYQENLEKVAKKLNSVNPDNDWVDIAIKNDLIEEDYTNEGGRY